ncbi:hypothetical protein [Diaphorobacter caeni]|uniref:hypothetical protein n=1 Tax=Diaphorobacter caeni TaxID=2784387 RepID=UPI00188E4401|nr:hypothetical protein [Diaphorobacter caeni]MBF5006381.1 hypothetical protein [Diaphorobacter caeni]
MSEIAELEGRIDALAQALMRVVAELESQRLLDGQRVSAAWRRARPARLACTRQLRASRGVLLQMADVLDEARAHRANVS